MDDLQASPDENHSVSLEYRGPRWYPFYRHSPRFVPIMRRKVSDRSYDMPRPFDYIVKGTPPSAFQPKNHSSVSFPQIPKDYVGKVRNIQDILKQISGDNDGGRETSTVGPKKVKIGGTYRHRKDMDAPEIFGNTVKHYSGTYPLSALTGEHSMKKESYKDPFYPFKPQSPGEINMLAAGQFQFVPPAWSNKLGASPSEIESEALRMKYMKNLYQQYLKYNQNKFFWDNVTRKQSIDQDKNKKPLSLMLDVYAMPTDDETPTTQPPPIPIKYRNPFFALPYMYQAALNHPLYNSYFQNMNFAQLQKQRFPDAMPYLNKAYFKKMLQSFQNQTTRKPQVDQLDHSPNQITVHLNLYPKNNKNDIGKTRNVEILSDHDLDPIHIASAERTTSNYKLEKDHILTTRSTIYNKTSLPDSVVDDKKTDDRLKPNEISLKTTDTHLKPSDLITLAEVFRKYYDDPKGVLQKNQHRLNVSSFLMVNDDSDSLKTDSTESTYVRTNSKQRQNNSFTLDSDKFIPIINGVRNIDISNVNVNSQDISNDISDTKTNDNVYNPNIGQNGNYDINSMPSNNNQWNQYYKNLNVKHNYNNKNYNTPQNNHNYNVVQKLSTSLPTTQDDNQWKPSVNQNFINRFKPEYPFENVQNMDTAENSNDNTPDLSTIIPIQPRIFHEDPKEFKIDTKFDYSEMI